VITPPGFVGVDKHHFYSVVWPRIKDRCEAVESNLKFVRNKLSWAPQPALIVHWGMCDKETGECTVLAISRSSGKVPDEHWAAAHLLDD
jgi:hypothetical protein